MATPRRPSRAQIVSELRADLQPPLIDSGLHAILIFKPTSNVARLLFRDGDSCWLCQGKLYGNAISIDHLIPRSHGGLNLLSNMRLAHPSCNARRGVKNCPRCRDPALAHLCQRSLLERAYSNTRRATIRANKRKLGF